MLYNNIKQMMLERNSASWVKIYKISFFLMSQSLLIFDPTFLTSTVYYMLKKKTWNSFFLLRQMEFFWGLKLFLLSKNA